MLRTVAARGAEGGPTFQKDHQSVWRTAGPQIGSGRGLGQLVWGDREGLGSQPLLLEYELWSTSKVFRQQLPPEILTSPWRVRWEEGALPTGSARGPPERLTRTVPVRGS